MIKSVLRSPTLILFSLFILSIPFSEIMMFNFHFFSLSISEIVYLLLLFFYFLKFYIRGFRFKKSILDLNSKLLLLFIISAFISICACYLKGYINFQPLFYFSRIILWMSVYFVIKDLFSKYKFFSNYFINLVYGVGLILILSGLIEFVGIHRFYSRPYWPISKTYLIGGLFGNPTTFGAFLCIFLGISLTYYFKNRFNCLQIIIISLIMLLSFLTGSRAVLLQIIIVALIIILLYKKRDRLRKILIGVSILFILYIFLVPYVPLAHIGSFTLKDTFNFQEQDIQSRFMIYRFNFNLWQNNPIFGIGPHNYTNLYDNFLPLKFSAIKNLNNPHNFFLLILTELGIFSFMFFVLFVFRTLIESFHKLKLLSQHIFHPAVGIWAGLIGFYLGSLFESLTTSGLWFTQFLLLGFLGCYICNHQKI